MGDGQEQLSEGRKSPADVGNRALADPGRPSVVMFQGRFIQKSNNDNGENPFKYDCTILFGCEFQAGFEKRGEQERSACSPSKQQSSAWTYLLAAAPTRSYLLAPPQPKEIGFWCLFFSFHFMKFYLLFSFDRFNVVVPPVCWISISTVWNCETSCVEISIVPETNRLLSCDILSHLIAVSLGRRLFIIH